MTEQRFQIELGPAAKRTTRPDQWSTRLPTLNEIQLHGVKHALLAEEQVFSQRTLWQVFFEGYTYPCTLMHIDGTRGPRWAYTPLMVGGVPEDMLNHVQRVRALDAEGTPVDWPCMPRGFRLETCIKTGEDMLLLLKQMRNEGHTQEDLRVLVELLRIAHRDDAHFEERALTALDMITGFVGNPAYRVFE